MAIQAFIHPLLLIRVIRTKNSSITFINTIKRIDLAEYLTTVPRNGAQFIHMSPKSQKKYGHPHAI